MALRKPVSVLVVLALGAAVGVMPAVAGSETTPAIEAVNSGAYYHYWVPPNVKVAPGGSVTFSNPTAVRHGIEWNKPPAVPACDSSVPVGTGEAASGTEWHGSCTFTTPGTYRFYCTVHGPSMSGTVTVGEDGTTTIVTSTGTSTPTGGGGTSTGAATPPAAGGAPTGSSVPGAGALTALKLFAAAPRGASVRGSLTIGPAATGGTLEIEVSSGRAQLARTATVVLGRLVRHGIQAGPLTFRVPLDARARAALHARGHLSVRVRTSVRPPHAAATVVSRSLLLHR